MRNVLFSLLVLLQLQLYAQIQTTKWNHPMRLKNCSIDIKAGQFTATTFVEMEFYNPNEQEIEGLYQFQLQPGQVITAFQLELNGKYRDGTLEEKWKATNAYNRIVGKRIDPALLSMDYNNYYRLNIYPVPAKSSRKITFTVEQLLTSEFGYLLYALPFDIADTVKAFHLSIISTVKEASPKSKPGIISDKLFTTAGDDYKLTFAAENIILKTSIAFAIPLSKTNAICTETIGSQKNFALCFQPNVDPTYQINPKEITVFWDASGSGENRNINLEIEFLQQFISYHHIRRMTIVPFNHQLLDTVIFTLNGGTDNIWKQYLQNITYDGATQLGCINLGNTNPELCMLFTDGRNTYGNKRPVTNGSLLYCINSSCNADIRAMNQMAGTSVLTI